MIFLASILFLSLGLSNFFCHLALEFCAAYVGLLTFGDICASPGVVFVRYAPYICALQVHYARYRRCLDLKKLASI